MVKEPVSRTLSIGTFMIASHCPDAIPGQHCSEIAQENFLCGFRIPEYLCMHAAADGCFAVDFMVIEEQCLRRNQRITFQKNPVNAFIWFIDLHFGRNNSTICK